MVLGLNSHGYDLHKKSPNWLISIKQCVRNILVKFLWLQVERAEFQSVFEGITFGRFSTFFLKMSPKPIILQSNHIFYLYNVHNYENVEILKNRRIRGLSSRNGLSLRSMFIPQKYPQILFVWVPMHFGTFTMLIQKK